MGKEFSSGNDLAEEFLELYRQLEHDGKRLYFKNASDKQSVIGGMMNLPQLKEYKSDIDYCRTVRNFLVHTPKVNHSYAIEPSEEMVDFLRKLLEHINNPMKAMDYAIKINNLYTVSLKSNIIEVVRYMQTMGYTHVPVMQEGKMFGVFSANVLYTYLSQTDEEIKNFDAELSILEKYLPIYKHTNEYFAFMPEDSTLHDVSKLFKIDVKSMKQLAAVFLTENGRADEKIIAMLTPYSILRDAPLGG